MATRRIQPDYEARLTNTRQKLDEWQVDAVLISGDSNRRWLSGFTGSAGRLLVTAEAAVLSTDFRYWEQAIAQAPAFELFRQSQGKRDISEFIALAATDRIGIEAAHLTLVELGKLEQLENINWVKLDATLEPLRAPKDQVELDKITAAAAITDQAMSQVNRMARPGMSERALAWELEKAMREAGAHGVAFRPHVASGPNSALPHHQPGDRILVPGDTIIVDMGAEIDGYKSDLTRTFYLGDQPTDRFWQIYNLVQEAQAAALSAARPGMSLQQVDSLAREVIDDAGFGEAFGHGLGHGIGLDVHEEPFLSRRPDAAERTIASQMVVTVEPGIYLDGWGGVRLEDLVCFKDHGLDVLSQCQKTPVISLA